MGVPVLITFNNDSCLSYKKKECATDNKGQTTIGARLYQSKQTSISRQSVSSYRVCVSVLCRTQEKKTKTNRASRWWCRGSKRRDHAFRNDSYVWKWCRMKYYLVTMKGADKSWLVLILGTVVVLVDALLGLAMAGDFTICDVQGCNCTIPAGGWKNVNCFLMDDQVCTII